MNKMIKSAASVVGLVAVFMLTSMECYAQYTDRTAFNLNGAVKSVTSSSKLDYILDGVHVGYTSLTFSRDGKGETWNEIDFPSSEYMSGMTLDRNAKGQISATTDFYPGGYSKVYYIYNAQGKIVTLKHENSDGEKIAPENCTYDADGNLIKEGKTVYTILTKDSHGNWLTRRYKDDYGEIKNDSRTITYYESAGQSRTTASTTSDLKMWELKGNVKSMQLFDDETKSESSMIGFSQQGKWTSADGQPVSTAFSEFNRDANGRVALTLCGDNDAITRKQYTYNNQGYVAKCNTGYGVDGYDKESYTYNEAGDLIKSRLIANMGYGEADEPAVSFTYTIQSKDNQGNWTRRTVAKSDGTSRVQKRVITYYDNGGTTGKKLFEETNGTDPMFDGGNAALREYILNNLNYPVKAQENKIEGKVKVQFTVMKDGSITNVAVVQSVDPSLDKEAVRIVENMPKWIPGTLNGKPINVRYTIPITFKL